ncbi:MAG: hypothetical protein U0892_15520 [Pirellulales bacterium]
MSDNPSGEEMLRQSLVQHAAAGLEDQFRSTVFLDDKNLRSVRFHLKNSVVEGRSTQAIFGLLEYEGDVESALTRIRQAYPFQVLKQDNPDPGSRRIEAPISPFAKATGWEQQDDMPETFELELRRVEPRVTIPFPATDADGDDAAEVREVVFIIHGIRDRARWQSRVRRILEEIPGVKAIPIKFGYLDVIRFWFPFWTRNGAVAFTQEQIQIGKNRYQAERYSVIAHSFGTYAITTILSRTKDLALHRLILCGSIVKRRFAWDALADRIKTEVINDYGTRDIWPLMAKKLSWGYDETGRYGFGRADVTDRAHDFEHSDFFDEDFIRDFWKPWFETGTYVKSSWEEEAPPSPMLLDIFSVVPFKSLFCILTPIIGFETYQHWTSIAQFTTANAIAVGIGLGLALLMLLVFIVRLVMKKPKKSAVRNKPKGTT